MFTFPRKFKEGKYNFTCRSEIKPEDSSPYSLLLLLCRTVIIANVKLLLNLYLQSV
jgi:hypothetical protein